MLLELFLPEAIIFIESREICFSYFYNWTALRLSVVLD